jgi:RING-type zinc-finger
MVLPCGHTFCKVCVYQIDKCSICKKPFKKYELSKNINLDKALTFISEFLDKNKQFVGYQQITKVTMGMLDKVAVEN